ncbi:23S rRNA methyltransferase [Thalassotalea sp. 42_200_T64]|nr:23S rRNA methyltransferase [Thalassotalea sp. 42_200_T64]
MTNKATIGLTNPKSPSNVGAVMRASGCYQVESVYYTGSRYGFASKFHTDTKNVSLNIPLSPAKSLLDVVPEGASIVCVDLVEGAIPLPEFQHPENAFYIFGPEDGTIEQSVVDNAADVVYIPTIGCMNLAATVNVVLYDRLAKAKISIDSDDLIRNSRDTNNKVKVRS